MSDPDSNKDVEEYYAPPFYTKSVQPKVKYEFMRYIEQKKGIIEV